MSKIENSMIYGKSYSLLQITTQGKVATITLNNGEVNVLGARLMKELKSVLFDFALDETIKVIVFESANPDFFIAHVDMHILEDQVLFNELVEEAPEGFNIFQTIGHLLRMQPQLTIVKLRGIARGGGAEFVTAADMCFASLEKGKLAQCEALMGIIPGGGGTQFLASKMPRNRVLEVILGADLFDAKTAETYGWINRAVPDVELDEFVNNLANNISELAEGIIEATKKVVAPSEKVEGFIAEHEAWESLVYKPKAGEIMTAALENGAQTVQGELELEKLLRAIY